jgi:hypothetical protein
MELSQDNLGCDFCAVTFNLHDAQCRECVEERDGLGDPLMLELERLTRENTELRMALAECENGGADNDSQEDSNESR